MENFVNAFANISTSLRLDLSINVLIRLAFLLGVGSLVIRFVMKLADRMLTQSKSLVSLRVYLRSAIQICLWFLLVLMAAESIGIPTSSVVAAFSVAGLAVSLALQNTLSNLAGGIMLLVTKPFQVGDFVESDGISGTISAIALSYTTFITPDNKEIFVPNSQLSAAKVINYTALGTRRVELFFSASYDAPTQTVKNAIHAALDTVPKILPDPAPVIWLSDYESSSIRYVLRLWTASPDYWDVYYALQEAVRESFAQYGVEMTYDHLNVHIAQELSHDTPRS